MSGFIVQALPAPPAYPSQTLGPFTEVEYTDMVWERRKAQEPKRNAERLDAWTTKIIDRGWIYGYDYG